MFYAISKSIYAKKMLSAPEISGCTTEKSAFSGDNIIDEVPLKITKLYAHKVSYSV